MAKVGLPNLICLVTKMRITLNMDKQYPYKNNILAFTKKELRNEKENKSKYLLGECNIAE